jgi:hypothetical protein
LETEQRKAVFSVVYNLATQRLPSISVGTKTNTEGEGYILLFFSIAYKQAIYWAIKDKYLPV